MKICEAGYADMSDKDLVTSIISGNEEAMMYLLYVRYAKDLRYFAYKYFNTLAYLDDLINDLFLRLKGRKGDWEPLKNFQWRSSFRTWFSSVASHLFLEKKKAIIDSSVVYTSIEETRSKENPSEPLVDDPDHWQHVILMEAINRLDSDLYRFILLKEIEGYNHKEIASMIVEQRRKRGIVSMYKGQVVTPDAHYVDMNKAKALKEVKLLVEKIKKD